MAISDADIDRIRSWVIDRGLAGDDEIGLLHGFCRRCVDAGLEISPAWP